jgi:hypothetical protein
MMEIHYYSLWSQNYSPKVRSITLPGMALLIPLFGESRQ